jgi:hypothetical protein
MTTHIEIVLTDLGALSYGRFKRTLFRMAEQQRCAMNSVFGFEKVDQKPYNSSIKPMGRCNETSCGFQVVEAL